LIVTGILEFVIANSMRNDFNHNDIVGHVQAAFAVLFIVVIISHSFLMFSTKDFGRMHKIGFFISMGLTLMVVFELVSNIFFDIEDIRRAGGGGLFAEQVLLGVRYMYGFFLTFFMLSIFFVAFDRRFRIISEKMVIIAIFPSIIHVLYVCSLVGDFSGYMQYYSCTHTQLGVKFILDAFFVIGFCYIISLNFTIPDIPYQIPQPALVAKGEEVVVLPDEKPRPMEGGEVPFTGPTIVMGPQAMVAPKKKKGKKKKGKKKKKDDSVATETIE
jgi:hypothetical protein